MEKADNKFGFNCYIDSRIGGRSENQDSYVYADTPLGFLVVVCDGMGGGPAGKTASSLSCKTIRDNVVSCKPSDNPEIVIEKAISAANSVLLDAISADESLMGMGTTCVALLVNHKSAVIAHVGDSRLYLLRNGKTVFKTLDHSYVADMVRQGKLSEEEARVSQHSNVITRAIGVRPTVETSVCKLNVKVGDRFAIMSDGIWGCIPENHLLNALNSDDSIDAIVTELSDRVDAIGHNEGGQHDNLTLALVDCFFSNSKKKASFESYNNVRGKEKSMIPSFLLYAFLISLGANIYLFYKNMMPNKYEFQITSKDSIISVLNKTIDEDEIKYKNVCDSLKQLKEEREKYLKKRKTIDYNIDVFEDKVNSIVNPKTRDVSNPRNNDGASGHTNVFGKHNPGKDLLDKAISILNQIDTLGDKNRNPQNREIFKKKRRELFDKMIKRVSDAERLYPIESKEKVESVLVSLKKCDKIPNGVDKFGKTTKECRDEIKKYKTLLVNLKY